jgi:hypothetical protein
MKPWEEQKMSDNAMHVVLGAALMALVGFCAFNMRQCEAQKPAIIEACHRTCGDRGVHNASVHVCECK